MIWMWEAKAAPGRADELVAWALAALGERDGEVCRSLDQPDELVVILLRRPAGAGAAPGRWPLPDPPADLVGGRVHAWPFEQVRRG